MRITIKSSQATATIDTLGAELKSFQDSSGLEYIWSGDPQYWRGTSPLLFPMVGNLRDGKTIIHGQEYSIPKHGFVRDKEFQVIDSSENSVTFSYQDNPETLEMYPYHFELRLTYTIVDSSLTLGYEVINKDNKVMYYHIGGHPGFNCPLLDDEQFSDYILRFEKKETIASPIYDLNNLHFDPDNCNYHLKDSDELSLDYSLFNQDAVVLDHLESRKVSLLNPTTGKGIMVDFNTFSTIAFWTPMNDTAPFLCIEPWNGSAIYKDEDNDFAHKRDIQIANVDETMTYELVFHIL